MQATYPDQKVSISKKLKEDWYKNNIKYWINQAMADNDKHLTATCLNAANGIVDAATYAYVLKPLSGMIDKKLPGEIRDIDFITPIKEKNIGEYIELPYYYLVKINDPDVALLRSKEVSDAIKPVIEQFVINKINEQQQTDVPSKDIGNLEGEITKIKDGWFDKRAKHVHNLIEFVSDSVDFEIKRIKGFYNWWATEECYFYCYIEKGQIYKEVLSPLEGYPVLAGEEFTDDGDAFMIKRKLSLTQVSTYYGDKLGKEDKEYLNYLTNQTSIGEYGYTVPVGVFRTIYNKPYIDSNGKVYGDNENFSVNQVINEYIVFFKTQVKKTLVTRINEVGEEIQLIVEDDYELDPELGDIDLSHEWIYETWKQVLLGTYDTGIYLKPEPIEVQIYDSRGNVKLPVFGKRGLLEGININPIPKRILPSLALYRILNLQIERLIAKYKTPVELIPKGLLNSIDGDYKGAMFYKLADSTIIYDETKFTGQDVANTYRIVGNDSAASFLRFLIDLRESIKSEAWDLANMNDSRYGQAAASSTVRNNEQNLHRAKLGSLLMTTMYNTILAKVHDYLGRLGGIVYNGGVSGSLFNKEERKVNYFNIPGGILSNVDYGIFTVNSVLEKDKLQEYKNLAFSAAQNGDFELAGDAISYDSVPAVRDAIREYTKRKEQFEKEQAELNRQSTERVEELKIELEKQKQENALEQIREKERLTTEREIQIANIKNSNKE